jgi:hypothetical protein
MFTYFVEFDDTFPGFWRLYVAKAWKGVFLYAEIIGVILRWVVHLRRVDLRRG